MGIIALLMLALMISGPVVILAGIVRTIIFMTRCVRAKRGPVAGWGIVAMIVFVILLGAMVAIWFGYGVAHTGKDALSDAFVMAITLLPAYLSVYFSWRAFARWEG